mmetsp:Transcript_16950/g.48379  ORF Transcript_16950/g.48379 Transcript_16950/m.48379 type:complete len:108 (+) Transcript_16950:521-844(+)
MDKLQKVMAVPKNLLALGQGGRVALLHKTMAGWLTKCTVSDLALTAEWLAAPEEGHCALQVWILTGPSGKSSFAHGVYYLRQSGREEDDMALLHNFSGSKPSFARIA